jgi:hypothetical protein
MRACGRQGGGHAAADGRGGRSVSRVRGGSAWRPTTGRRAALGAGQAARRTCSRANCCSALSALLWLGGLSGRCKMLWFLLPNMVSFSRRSAPARSSCGCRRGSAPGDPLSLFAIGGAARILHSAAPRGAVKHTARPPLLPRPRRVLCALSAPQAAVAGGFKTWRPGTGLEPVACGAPVLQRPLRPRCEQAGLCALRRQPSRRAGLTVLGRARPAAARAQPPHCSAPTAAILLAGAAAVLCSRLCSRQQGASSRGAG